jgi:hypothetical protein
MAQIRAGLKRAFLRAIYQASQSEEWKVFFPSSELLEEAQSGLGNILTHFLLQNFDACKQGRFSVGSSGLGHEVRWAPPAIWAAMSQDQVFELAEELIEIYEDAKAAVGFGGDAEIFARMLADDRLQSVTSLNRDFTAIRIPWSRLG